MPDERSDSELVQAANGGEEGAFEALYFRHRDWVVRLAYRFTGNREDALDVMQETFLYLAGKFPGFRLTSSMTTFLYPVVKHKSSDARRKVERFVTGGEVPERADERRREGRGDLEEALGALGEAAREVVLMRYADDMTVPEIARALGVAEGTVKSRLHYAIETLRRDKRTREYFLE